MLKVFEGLFEGKGAVGREEPVLGTISGVLGPFTGHDFMFACLSQ